MEAELIDDKRQSEMLGVQLAAAYSSLKATAYEAETLRARSEELEILLKSNRYIQTFSPFNA